MYIYNTFIDDIYIQELKEVTHHHKYALSNLLLLLLLLLLLFATSACSE
jgi:glucan phosphoethanolaminetransferase (alkaline phosphatase superfamily)